MLTVLFWGGGCLTYEGVGTLGPVEDNINSKKYRLHIEILREHFCGLSLLNFPKIGSIYFKRIMPLSTHKGRP